MPLGPLGPLDPLGPLGPLGVHSVHLALLFGLVLCVGGVVVRCFVCFVGGVSTFIVPLGKWFSIGVRN